MTQQEEKFTMNRLDPIYRSKHQNYMQLVGKGVNESPPTFIEIAPVRPT